MFLSHSRSRSSLVFPLPCTLTSLCCKLYWQVLITLEKGWFRRMVKNEHPTGERKLVPGGSFLIGNSTYLFVLTWGTWKKVGHQMKNKANGRECRHVGDQKGKREQWIQGQRRNPVVRSPVDKKPMQVLKEMGRMIKSGTAEDRSNSMVLTFLEFFIIRYFGEPASRVLQQPKHDRAKAQRRVFVVSSVRVWQK